ncbi:cuticle protein CP14.6-like [Contarinia nasturtii]|uniref:cuticle protein CP14.6-like n=1 Tax=Contarinia nasturtii TaxID=265458 RepID=UPI0012D3EC97|nr:cuticle protein CP14.6-like [Contarinia nasturtii]
MIKITIIALVAILGIAMAFPQDAVLTRSEIRDDFNQFALSYSSDKGYGVSQQGALKTIDTENGKQNIYVQRGIYAFYGTDGKKYTVEWIADENGFRATGDHIPVAPPAPEVPMP